MSAPISLSVFDKYPEKLLAIPEEQKSNPALLDAVDARK